MTIVVTSPSLMSVSSDDLDDPDIQLIPDDDWTLQDLTDMGVVPGRDRDMGGTGPRFLSQMLTPTSEMSPVDLQVPEQYDPCTPITPGVMTPFSLPFSPHMPPLPSPNT